MREKTKIFENSFEDYGLSKEAIICLKSVGCNNPQDVYEKVAFEDSVERLKALFADS